MRTDQEKEYLIKAIDVSARKFIIISPEFKILAANIYTVEKLGNSVIGQLCHQALYDNSEPCKNCAAAEVIKTGRSSLRKESEGVVDQEWKSCLFAYPIYSGQTIEAVSMLDFDLASMKNMEVQLQRSNAFLRNLILSSVDGVVAADKTGKILIFNDAAVEISGYSVDEALNSLNIRDFYPDGGAYDIMNKLRSDEYGEKGKLKSYRVEVLRKDGETIPISLDASIVYEGSEEVATIGFFHDMRDELRIRSELERTQVQLLQAEKMSSLGKLAAGVAHQLNNPIGGITLFAKLILEEYTLEDGAKEDMNRILQDAQRCKDTVKELLEFARQTSHFIKPHDINKAISRTLFLLENQAIFQNIEIKRDFNEDLPLVPVDIQQMNHVFMNIILNAAQAMEGNGELRLKTSLSANNGKVRIEISDTGPGIPEEMLSQIFDPFFTTKEEGKGTGLGLSIVYGIIQEHSGEIQVKSKKGEGTVFIIELPLEAAEKKGDQSGE